MKKRVTYRFVFISAFLFLYSCGFSQSLDSIAKTFAAYSNQAVQEKLFVHTDKSFYVAGETVWLKCYQVEAASNKPLDLSKVVYVDLLNNQKEPVLQAKLIAKNGTSDGYLEIPTALTTGSYILRAYTSWMQNFAPAFYFSKELVIVNPFKKPDWKSLEKPNTVSLQIFPEGGNLVYGLSNTVAYKLVDVHGAGVENRGYVVSSANDTVAKFQSYKFGMGSFQFKPEQGKAYRMEVQSNGGERISKIIDSIYARGYVVHVNSNKDEAQVAIEANANNSETLYCLVHTRQSIKHAELIRLADGVARFTIDKKKLGDGISHLTVFNSDRQPVCERLLFKTPSKQFQTKITTDKAEYKGREKVSLALQAVYDSNRSIKANASLAIYHLDSLQKKEAETISTYLWLTSDLGTAIDSAAYYFTHPEDEQAIDLLMLTSGWRRFNWNKLLTQKPSFAFLPEYEGHLIKAQFLNKKTGLPAAGLNVYLSVPGKNFQFRQTRTDAQGIANFVTQNFTSNNGLILQAAPDSTGYHIQLLSPFSASHPGYFTKRFPLSDKQESELTFASEAMQVNNIFNPDPSVLPSSKDSTHFYGKPYKTYWLDDFTRFPTMEEVLKEYVTEVRVRKQRASFGYNVFNATYKTFFDLPPLVLVDGVPFFNADKVMSLDPLQVQKIDVVASKLASSSAIHNGLISYISYKGDLASLSLEPGAIMLEYDGLQQKREFFAPTYETEAMRQSRLPDFRNLLHWVPNVSITSNSASQLSFYTGDVKGQYLIVVQALASDGSTSYNYSTISVTK